MAYGTIKVDNITFDNGGVDKLITVSGLFYSTSGALTVTGAISGGSVTAPTATFTTLTGTTTAGTTATFTSGSFTSLTGVTTTVTSRFIIGQVNNVGGLSETTRTTSGIFNTSRLLDGGTNPYLQTGAEAGIVYFNSDGSSVPATVFRVSGAEKVRIDSSGRLGIGTTPVELLDVAGNIRQTGNTAGTANTVGLIDFYNTNSTSTIARINVRTDGATNSGSYRISTANAGTLNEVVRIDSSGRLLVGVIASPAHQLQVSTDSAGKPSSALWTIVSDERIKEDIELADLDLCYEAIKAIPLKRYKWRDDIYSAEQVTDRRKLGWIAQDVEAIFPKAVGTHEFKYNQVFEKTIIPAVEKELDADGNVITPAQPERIEQGDLISEDVIEDCRDLNSDQLYAAMYGAVQKLMAKVETLEASNTELLTRLSALEAA